jgi:hypothetical protein
MVKKIDEIGKNDAENNFFGDYVREQEMNDRIRAIVENKQVRMKQLKIQSNNLTTTC